MSTAESSPSGLSGRAQLNLLVVCAAAVGGYLDIWNGSAPSGHDWRLAGLLAAVAALTQLFRVVTPRNQSYHLSLGVVLAAAILLPPALVALVVVVQHVPEWLKERLPWFIQTFNIANYAIAALLAGRMFHTAASTRATLGGHAAFFVAGLAAAVVFVAVQHSLLAVMLKLARGHAVAGTGLFTLQSLSIDTVLALIGVVVAELWQTNPYVMALALVPLVLLHRTLTLPKLEAEARQDAKTGLYNARHLSIVLDETIEHALRHGSPVSLLVVDLDLLREINNRHGHLAGDAALTAVAGVLQREAGTHGVAARFGGDEFCLLLPGTSERAAHVVAERIRAAVASLQIAGATSSSPISATVSIGVASLPEHAASGQELIHRADACTYRAKALGRNCVVTSSMLTVLDEAEWAPSPSLSAPAPLLVAGAPVRPAPRSRVAGYYY